MMALTKIPATSTIAIKFINGTNKAGNPIERVVNFTGVKNTASDDDIYAIGNSLAGLQLLTLKSISRIDTNALEATPAANS